METVCGAYAPTKVVVAISTVPRPTDSTSLFLNLDGSFATSDWPAWSLVPLNGKVETSVLKSSGGTWKLLNSNQVILQFSRSPILPLGAVLILKIRQGSNVQLKVSLNAGNEDDFMILERRK